MDDDSSQLVFTTRDPLLSSSNVAMTVTCNLSQTSSSACFSTPLNSPLLLSPSTPLWSPVSLRSPSSAIPHDVITGQTFNSDDFQTPEVLGEIVIGEEEESEEEGPGVCVRTPGGSGRARTPRTISRLLEQHRTSERNRHHDLNATIDHICSGIPGYSPFVRETKIIKLQRIINYICHIESHIHSLCDDMGVALDFKNIFLSAKTSASMNKRASSHSATKDQQHFYEPEAPIPYSISRKMKLRSPTVDSTTKDEEEELDWLKNCSGLESPDNTILTPDDCDQILSSLDVGAQVTVDEKAEECQNEPSDSSRSVPSTPFTGIHDSHQAFQRVPFAQSHDYSLWPRKRSTRRSGHTEACVPSTPVTPLRRSQRRRVLRSPLLRLASLFRDSSSECEEDDDDEADDDFRCTAVPHDWARKESLQNEAHSVMTQKSILKKSKSHSKSQVDHRKTSWMNGFMMYSRIHRRQYIRDNPGVHTSHISKLMGHDWRAMPPEEQKPYKEKAGQYTQQFLMPSPDQLLAKSQAARESTNAETRDTSVSHLVPCFHSNTPHPNASDVFNPIDSPTAPPFVKLENLESGPGQVPQAREIEESLCQRNQLVPDTETSGDFTQLSSSPSKRALEPSQP